MEIRREKPPLYEEIAKVFDIKGKPVIFAWGGVIYAPPPNGAIGPHLIAHEEVHGFRQRQFPEITGWWRRYLHDPVFRLEEEKLAHIAEYQWLVDHSGGRAERRRHLSHVAARLSAPLYRYSITKDEARRVLENGYQRDEGRL